MMTPLQLETAAYIQLRDWLAREYEIAPLDLADTLEGATNLHEMIGAVSREIGELEARVEALRSVIIKNKERAARYERAIGVRRSAIAAAMEAVDLPKVTAPDATISRRAINPRARVVSEDMLPEQFWKEKIVRSPDMEKIAESAEKGVIPAGVVMSNGGSTITITRK